MGTRKETAKLYTQYKWRLANGGEAFIRTKVEEGGSTMRG